MIKSILFGVIHQKYTKNFAAYRISHISAIGTYYRVF